MGYIFFHMDVSFSTQTIIKQLNFPTTQLNSVPLSVVSTSA